MNILHISTETSWRGGEQQLIYLHEELIRRSVSSTVVCKVNSPVHTYCKEKNLPHIPFAFSSAYDLKAALKLKTISKNHHADIIHIHTAKGHTLAIISVLLGLKTLLVLSRRVDFPVKKNWFSRFKYNHHQIKKIVCVSNAIKEIMARDIYDNKKLTTVHSGIDIRKFDHFKNTDHLRREFTISEEKLLIGNTSALADHKDYFTFINTAEILLKENSNLHFFIMGDGPMKEEIEAYIQDKGLIEHITMTGFLKNIGEALCSLDLFLFTSKTEGLGTSVLDAMAAGIPIVATRAGGVSEMIETGHNGYLAEVGDEENLAKCVLEVLKNASIRSKFISNSLEKVKEFSYQATTKKTIEVYQEVLN